METIIAGTPQIGWESSNIYPDQTLTMYYLSPVNQSGAGHWLAASPSACFPGSPQHISQVGTCASAIDSATNDIEGPRWSSRSFADMPNNGKMFNGRSVGDFRMTGSDELVNIPGHYVTPEQLTRVKQCDMRQTARDRGVGWQSANISSECKTAPFYSSCF